jgi:2-hydroxychromene-2-carboxylate isomerase
VGPPAPTRPVGLVGLVGPTETVGPTLPAVLTLHHDITSPRSALAVLRIQRLADAGHAVAFRGIDVLGVAVALPVTLDQLVELEQVAEAAATLGLVMRRPNLRPPTLDAHLVGELAERVGSGAAWRLACLRAYYTDGTDVSDHAALLAIAERVGLERSAVLHTLADVAARNELRAAMLARRALGIGGVPILEVDGTLLHADVDDATLEELARV